MSLREQYGDEISLKLDGHVAVLEINRPPNNHVTLEMTRQLNQALHDLEEEPLCRAILLCSAGKVFCAGADLSAPNETGGIDPPGGSPLYVEAVKMFGAKKPMVAAVQGAAVGAGLGLALVADFRVAAPEARFAANFVKLGFHPGFALTYTLPRLIGEQRGALMLLTGRRIKADEALEWGLVDQVVPLDKVRETAMELAREIAENAPLAVESTRATLREGLAAATKAQTDIEFREQAWLRKTNDYTEGLKAVAERRPGNFTRT